ncbi:hypothetical protein ONZ45_g11279 [Pleurotus djamor]|nr:hypothetical protein ONZ45_g11279 [Pleurotus djamor]
MSAYIHNIPVSFRFDLSVSRSTLSFHVARTFLPHLKPGDSDYTGITIPTDRGPFSTNLSFLVVDNTEPVVVLGADWMAVFIGVLSSRSLPDHPISNSRGLVSGSDAFPINCDVSMLQDVLRHDMDHLTMALTTTDSLLYAFHDNALVLHTHMLYHGIRDLPDGIEESQEKLLHHLLSAACMVDTTDGERHSACARFSRTYQNSLHMSYEAYNIFLRRDDISVIQLRVAWKGVYGGANIWRHEYSDLRRMLRAQCDKLVKTFSNLYPLKDTIHLAYYSRKDILGSMTGMHGMTVPRSLTRSQTQRLLIEHILKGECFRRNTSALGCAATLHGLAHVGLPEDEDDSDLSDRVDDLPADESILKIEMYRVLLLALKPVDLVLLRDVMGVSCSPDLSGKALAALIADQISLLDNDTPRVAVLIKPYHSASRHNEPRQWPVLLDQQVKDDLISNFLDETSSRTMSSAVCGVCAEHVRRTALMRVRADQLPLHLLSGYGHNYGPTLPSHMSYPRMIKDGLLSPYLIDPLAVHDVSADTLNSVFVDVCMPCQSTLSKGKLPACALANGTFVGDVPIELSNLSVVEEAMIALCRTKCMVVQLREIDGNRSSPINQKAIKGNIIVYPQDASSIAKILPPSLAEMASFICVMFVGTMGPSDETLLRSAPLAVRGDKVFKALQWLKSNNFLYQHIEIDLSMIREVSRLGYIPFHVQRIGASHATSRSSSALNGSMEPNEALPETNEAIPFDSVVIDGVDPVAAPNAIRAAALKHLKDNHGNFIRIPYGHTPVNSFDNPSMFPMMFPSLFPFGVGGFEDKTRSTSLSMKIHVKHLLNLFDKRFQQHHVFMFSAFNILQRRESLLRISLRTKQASFQDIAAQLTSISSAVIHEIYERMQAGGSFVPANDQESRVYKLMQEVNAVISGVPGSPSGKLVMRNQIRALMLEKGMPSFFVTLNPADVYNPIVKFLSGSQIDIDHMPTSEIPTYWTQALLVAKNPVGGVLGFTNAYYGCVETQGRGTLHCHMLVWLDGALNPDQIKERLLSDKAFALDFLRYLEDIIHNSTPSPPEVVVPSDDVHPSALRTVYPRLSTCPSSRTKDFHNVVKVCQHHKHSHTCYKYCVGSVRDCRFGLGVERERANSSIDEDGVVLLRCQEGLVNDYNPTILEATRCNMDIKFIGSGAAAKATLYYITDYITKPDEKSYTSYAALELAVRRIEEFCDSDMDLYTKSKKLLQRCASSMISRQEISAPFVAAQLLGLEDHYTSHQFKNLYWTTFERFVDHMLARSQDIPENFLQNESPELAFDVGDDGVLTPITAQVEDYVHRSPTLEDLSVWDMMAQLRKERIKNPLSHKLHSFVSGHRDQKSHGFAVLSRSRVPVLVGPGLPRRDRQETAERHAKVSLILFKPWRVVSDLKSSSESWQEAYNVYLRTIPQHALFVINNMQLLHECRDSRDDHYDAARKARKVVFSARAGGISSTDDANVETVLDEEEMLEHIESVDRAREEILSRNRIGVTESLLSAVDSGLVDTMRNLPFDQPSLEDSPNVVSLDGLPERTSRAVESRWKKGYKDLANPSTVVPATNVQPASDFQASIARVQNSTLLPNDSATIVEGSRNFPTTGEEMISAVEQEYTLNKEQRRAFRIVTNHSLQPDSSQLKMYLMGFGGTGKSRVIHALTEFFDRRGQSHRFTIGAFTGVAAMHIGGGTLHSMLNLKTEARKDGGKDKHAAKSLRKLMAKWEEIEYLLIDEVSMVGCGLLHDISEALMIAKGSQAAFGGINIIFCGDFAQLPPVKQLALFTQFDSKRCASMKANDALLLGRNLWLQVDCVVELTEVMRQAGAENAYFISLLNRVRDGKCTEEDHQRLNDRLITKVKPDWDSDRWMNTPVIVYSNDMKDGLNTALASAYAVKHDKPFHWYHSEDTCDGQPIVTEKLRRRLSCVDSGRSRQRMGKLPLVEGMPVMITQNYAVELGIANGSIGTLRQIRYETNQFNERVAISCTVLLPDSKFKFPGLEEGEAPVLQDDAYFTFVDRYSRRKRTFKRKQLCVMPGFAFTAHKAEGMTLTNVIVDIESCRGIESVYVMLSRVKSLDGLLLLRPFGLNKIRCRPSQDRRIEADRLRILCLETICRYGDPVEIRNARKALQALKLSSGTDLNDHGKRPRPSD